MKTESSTSFKESKNAIHNKLDFNATPCNTRSIGEMQRFYLQHHVQLKIR